jgi:5,10-methylenetetrahydrofolate reductase
MSALNPLWMHVTWGAGGSTQERSLELAGASQGMGLETCLHLTCTNLEQGVLEKTLEVRCGSSFLRACPFTSSRGYMRALATVPNSWISSSRLQRAKAAGIVNLLALRGGKP